MKKRMIGISANGKKFLLNVKEENGKLIAGTDFQEKAVDIPVEEPAPAEAVEEAIEIEVFPETITLRTQFENYISSQKGILSDATLKIYENIKNKHVKSLMDMDVSNISIADIQKALDEELSNGISETTVKKYRQVIKKVIASSNLN